ncbi:uncharacterized protein BXZ73DRAFT_74895 [Epithele typhae]|uniref:uncharacterized protein n=1 Tax=Epithele typhae TaxID=378194 RepID=UPI00200765DD|nr:uncharacterized protein BXZ73DRAFT_74895 [Epithele typhae]KAH9941700.1 hypothetical protein BXZ73DRAFT_74895 [Epithele typhae]
MTLSQSPPQLDDNLLLGLDLETQSPVDWEVWNTIQPVLDQRFRTAVNFPDAVDESRDVRLQQSVLRYHPGIQVDGSPYHPHNPSSQFSSCQTSALDGLLLSPLINTTGAFVNAGPPNDGQLLPFPPIIGVQGESMYAGDSMGASFTSLFDPEEPPSLYPGDVFSPPSAAPDGVGDAAVAFVAPPTPEARVPYQPLSEVVEHSPCPSLSSLVSDCESSESSPGPATPPSIGDPQHNGKQFQCDICLEWFSTKFNLGQHKKSGKHADIRPFPCPRPDCGRAFAKKHDLTRHVVSHEGISLRSEQKKEKARKGRVHQKCTTPKARHPTRAASLYEESAAGSP